MNIFYRLSKLTDIVWINRLLWWLDDLFQPDYIKESEKWNKEHRNPYENKLPEHTYSS